MSMRPAGIPGSLVGLLIGIIVIVFAAFGLSLLGDRGQSSSLGDRRLGREIEDKVVRIEFLRRRMNSLEAQYAKNKSLAAQEEVLKSLRREFLKKESEIPVLQSRKENLSDGLTTLEDEFKKIRQSARMGRWTHAVGRPMDNVISPSGVPYQDAFITRIDATGIKIRHRNGSALIPVSSISENLREEFDLSITEGREAMRKRSVAENKLRDAIDEEILQKRIGNTGRRISKLKLQDIKLLKQNAEALQKMYQRAKEAADHARMMEREDAKKRTPDGKETWAMRALRLTQEESQFRSNLLAANAALQKAERQQEKRKKDR